MEWQLVAHAQSLVSRESVTKLTNIRASKSDCAQWAIFHAFPRDIGWILQHLCIGIGINICPVIICFQSAIHIICRLLFSSLQFPSIWFWSLRGQKDLANKSNIWWRQFMQIRYFVFQNDSTNCVKVSRFAGWEWNQNLDQCFHRLAPSTSSSI